MGEDSGLEVDALGGAPGIFSARYAGLPDGSIKNAHLLDLLRAVPQRRRRCQYRCALVLAEAEGREHLWEGACVGRIAQEPAGDGGFGFDPIFFVPRLGRTLAQLSNEERLGVNHRGRAARQMARYLGRRTL